MAAPRRRRRQRAAREAGTPAVPLRVVVEREVLRAVILLALATLVIWFGLPRLLSLAAR